MSPNRSRAAWPVRRAPLVAPPDDDLSESTTAEERLAMMWPLALEAWAVAGLSLPDYPRDQAPVGKRSLQRNPGAPASE
jgi:hypothetical protein